MDKEIILTKRFKQHFDNKIKYLVKEWSAASAFKFIEKVHSKIAAIKKNPSVGKPSGQVNNVRSVPVKPYNRIYYRETSTSIEMIAL